MKWLNIEIPSLLQSAEYRKSTPADRGTWLAVVCFACQQQCGGVILGGATWSDREWIQACGATVKEIRAARLLLAIEGDDVHVFGYPLEAEVQVRENGKNAKLGAAARWGKERAKSYAETMPPGNAEPMPPGINTADAKAMPPGTKMAMRNRKEKEEIEKETPPQPPKGGGLAEGDDPNPEEDSLMATVRACGGFLVHPTTSEDLWTQWEIAVQGLAPQHVREVFAEGPRLPAEGTIRYPDRFTRVRAILRQRAQQAQTKRENAAREVERQAKAQTDADEHQALAQAAHEPAQRLVAYLQGLDPIAQDDLAQELAGDPAVGPVLKAAITKGTISALGVVILRRSSAELAAIADGQPAVAR